LGILGRYLLLATEGEDIVRLQTQLAALDLYHGSRDGIFEPLTQEAVKRFQLISGLVVDGVVGPETWKALGGSWTEPNPRRLRLAEIALEEANKNLSWTGPDSEPEKYLAL
jgi:murein L,D-transpeptidase YcbB/YkuD